jgi:hypothetical protein
MKPIRQPWEDAADRLTWYLEHRLRFKGLTGSGDHPFGKEEREHISRELEAAYREGVSNGQQKGE